MFSVLLDLLLRPFTKTHTIIKDIGRGSFGTVLLAKDTSGTLCVAKFVKRGKVRDHVGGVPLEVYLLSQLRHANIVTCTACFQLPHHWAFTMPYLEDYCDVKTLVRCEGRLGEDSARRIFVQTLGAVLYCLSRGVDHRDIKHENILVHRATLHVQLIDFGLASLCTRDTVYTSPRGTQLFLPPEAVLPGSCRYTPAGGTVWALGCLLYCMLLGRIPFMSRRDVVFTELPLSHMGSTVRDFLGRCLQKNHVQRITLQSLPLHPWLLQHGDDLQTSYQTWIPANLNYANPNYMNSYANSDQFSSQNSCYRSAGVQTVR